MSPAAPLPPPWQRMQMVVFACLQTMLCAGIVFGWASVAGSLLIAPFEEGGTNLTMDETTTIFSIAASTASLSSLFLGFILDTKGPRICSLVAHSFIGIGCYVFSIATSYRGFLWGTSLMAFGGPGVQSAVIHLANLFPDQQFTVMACVTGSVTLSFAILPIFDYLWEVYGFGFRIMFRSYVAVVAVSALGAFLLWPDAPFAAQKDDKKEDTAELVEMQETATCKKFPTLESLFAGTASHTQLVEAPLGSYLRSNSQDQMQRHQSYHQSIDAMVVGNYSSLSVKDQPFWCQLLSGVYARILLVFICTSFMANFYVASLTVALADLNYLPPDVQHSMARNFTLITSSGMLGSFLVGWLMDRIGLASCMILTIVMGQMHMLIVIFCSDMPGPLLFGFFVYTLFRQFLFPVFIACLSARLGFKYFGMLQGLGFASSGLAQLFLAALVQAVQGTCHVQMEEGCSKGYWKELHVFQFWLLTALLLVPLLDVYFESKRTKNRLYEARQKEGLPTDYGSMEDTVEEYGQVYEVGILI